MVNYNSEAMQINWFTVIAQIINFFILVSLLKRYLYKPILRAIEKREKKIASRLKDAESLKKEALTERESFQKKNKQFDLEKKKNLDEAIEDVKRERQQMLEDARKEYYLLQSKLAESLREEEININNEIFDLTRKEVLNIVRKVLNDLATSTLEENTINLFIRKLEELNEEEIKRFQGTSITSGGNIQVKTAFDLTFKQKKEIENQLEKITQQSIEPEFELKPELVCGIELDANGFRLSWNVNDYIHSIEKNMQERLKEKLAPLRGSKRIHA